MFSISSSSNTHSSTSPSRHKSSFEQLSARLGHPSAGGTAALAASVTPNDTVILTADGHRLPGLPLPEAQQLNCARLDHERKHATSASSAGEQDTATFIPLTTIARPSPSPVNVPQPPAYTHPLFPPLPLYGPATPLRKLQSYFFRFIAGILSTCFLLAIVVGSLYRYIPITCKRWYRWAREGKDPDQNRPFYQIELERAKERRKQEHLWEKEAERNRKSDRGGAEAQDSEKIGDSGRHSSAAAEGGFDKLIPDIGYYARRIGLDVEGYKVETEDGFLICLQRVFDPNDPPADVTIVEDGYGNSIKWNKNGRRKYPILLIHGLLQSSGAFCVNDNDSLAFFLCKSGYDVWLGNNRCGSIPEHSLLTYSDPRMWAWNIRQMGILDLPTFINHILLRTGFPKLALVAHSQGTAEAFVALAREQRPELGAKISIFCALAPAVYAGKLVEEVYFKFMGVVSPGMFRLIFGIHAFIPMMMWFQKHFPGWLYGNLGYRVFSFLFKWTDLRWDRGLRNRFFRFSPVYVSAESMRWWLGRDCFATQKCILATEVEEQREDDKEMQSEQQQQQQQQQQPQHQQHQQHQQHLHQQQQQHKRRYCQKQGNGNAVLPNGIPKHSNDDDNIYTHHNKIIEEPQATSPRGEESDSESEGANRSTGPWYNHKFPPLALWICGSDDLVDGKRFLKRLQKGREPHVRLVHQKIIEDYEHLDVLWAVDSVQEVGWEVRDVVWKIVKEEMEGSMEQVRNNREDQRVQWWRDLSIPRGVRKGIATEEQELGDEETTRVNMQKDS